MSIGELAEAAGLSRRAVRFYVQRGLLPAPLGLGRGRHYDGSHVQRLQQIQQLQSAGHSLEGIGKILQGKAVAPPAQSAPVRPRPALAAELWTRLPLTDGLELHFDAAKHNPSVDSLLALREAAREILKSDRD